MVSRRPAIMARLVSTPRPRRNAKPIATRTEMRFLMSDQRDTAGGGAHDVAHERTAPPRRADRARRADGETGARPYGSSAGPLDGRSGGRLRGRPPTAVRMARPG